MGFTPCTNVCPVSSYLPSSIPSMEEKEVKLIAKEHSCPVSEEAMAASGSCDDFLMDMLAGELFLQSELTPQEIVDDSSHGLNDMFPSLNDLTSQESILPQMMHDSWSMGEELEYPSPSLAGEEDILHGEVVNHDGILDEEEEDEEDEGEQEGEGESISHMFGQWLRSNSHAISLEDLRRIKLKTSTIENATRKLGGGKKGLMLFIKSVLMWVQNCDNIKQAGEIEVPCNLSFLGTEQYDRFIETEQFGCLNKDQGFSYDPHVNNMMNHIDSYECNERSDGLDPWWVPTHHHRAGCGANFSFAHDPSDKTWIEQASRFRRNRIPCSSSPSSSSSSVTIEGSLLWGNEYNPNESDLNCSDTYRSSLMTMRQGEEQYNGKLSPAATTRAARKSRMERKRLSVRKSRKWAVNAVSPSVNQPRHRHQQQRDVSFPDASGHGPYRADVSSWSQVMDKSSQIVDPAMAPVPWPIQGPFSIDSHHCIKELGNDARLLFHKELKQSDVGNLGRIVLPKKAAESYLPYLESRDGMNLEVEDFGSPKIWNMRYRFWPNNKSRMYLLENTGNFVKSYNLKEGDQMQLYFNLQSNRYMVRGTKRDEETLNCEEGVTGADEECKAIDAIVGMSPEEFCDDPLLVELIEESLENFRDSTENEMKMV